MVSGPVPSKVHCLLELLLQLFSDGLVVRLPQVLQRDALGEVVDIVGSTGRALPRSQLGQPPIQMTVLALSHSQVEI
eukprot:4049521-Amphidinium_carterae.2